MQEFTSAVQQEPAGNRNWDLASALLLVVGAALRWYGLGRFPFEQDELYTLQEARELFATTLRPGIDARPLYYLLHHALTPYLPASEFGTRLPAFCFGVMGLWVTLRLGHYLFGRPGGFLALTLAVFSPWQLFVSGEARYWSLTYLLAAGTLLMVLQAREQDNWRKHIAAGLLIILGAFTHPTFLFPLVGIAVALLAEPTDEGWRFRWPSRGAMLGTWAPAALAIGGYLLYVKLQGRGSSLSNWSGRGWLATLRLLPAMVQLATPVMVAASAVGIVAALRYGNNHAKRMSVVSLGGLTSGATLLVAASLRTDVYADYGVSMLPIGIASVAGVLLLSTAVHRGAMAISTAIIVVAAMLPETVSQLSDGMRFDYRPAFATISAQAPEIPTFTWPIAIQRYYAPALTASEFSRNVSQLDSLASVSRDFWVVASMNRRGMVGDSNATAQSWLISNCAQPMDFGKPRLDYREYRVVLFRCRHPLRTATP